MDADFKRRIIGISIIFLLCIAVVVPACAGSKEDSIAEQAEAMKSPEYLKYQWSITNFEVSDGHTTFWISNEKAPEIKLKEVSIKDHDTGREISFIHSEKVTKEKKSTANLWNLFGLFDPKDQLSNDQMLQINLEGDYLNRKNIDVIYNGVTITHYGKIQE